MDAKTEFTYSSIVISFSDLYNMPYLCEEVH